MPLNIDHFQKQWRNQDFTKLRVGPLQYMSGKGETEKETPRAKLKATITS